MILIWFNFLDKSSNYIFTTFQHGRIIKASLFSINYFHVFELHLWTDMSKTHLKTSETCFIKRKAKLKYQPCLSLSPKNRQHTAFNILQSVTWVRGANSQWEIPLLVLSGPSIFPLLMGWAIYWSWNRVTTQIESNFSTVVKGTRKRRRKK